MTVHARLVYRDLRLRLAPARSTFPPAQPGGARRDHPSFARPYRRDAFYPCCSRAEGLPAKLLQSLKREKVYFESFRRIDTRTHHAGGAGFLGIEDPAHRTGARAGRLSRSHRPPVAPPTRRPRFSRRAGGIGAPGPHAGPLLQYTGDRSLSRSQQGKLRGRHSGDGQRAFTDSGTACPRRCEPDSRRTRLRGTVALRPSKRSTPTLRASGVFLRRCRVSAMVRISPSRTR